MEREYRRQNKSGLARNDIGHRAGQYSRRGVPLPLAKWSVEALQIMALRHGEAGAPYRHELLRRDGIEIRRAA